MIVVAHRGHPGKGYGRLQPALLPRAAPCAREKKRPPYEVNPNTVQTATRKNTVTKGIITEIMPVSG